MSTLRVWPRQGTQSLQNHFADFGWTEVIGQVFINHWLKHLHNCTLDGFGRGGCRVFLNHWPCSCFFEHLTWGNVCQNWPMINLSTLKQTDWNWNAGQCNNSYSHFYTNYKIMGAGHRPVVSQGTTSSSLIPHYLPDCWLTGGLHVKKNPWAILPTSGLKLDTSFGHKKIFWIDMKLMLINCVNFLYRWVCSQRHETWDHHELTAFKTKK